MSIFNEAQQLEHLTVMAKSLVRYSMSLEPGISFERQDDWWLPNNETNFVGFQFHWSTQVSITLSLYGSPQEQLKHSSVNLRKSKFNCSALHITSEDQLMAATVGIWRAFQLFNSQRNQKNGALLLLDEAEADRDCWLRPRPGFTLPDQTDVSVTETTEWYDEVKNFMKQNKIIDSSIFV